MFLVISTRCFLFVAVAMVFGLCIVYFVLVIVHVMINNNLIKYPYTHTQPDRGPAALSASRSTEDGTTAGRSLSEERRSRHATITTISSSVLLTSAVIYGERR